MTSEPSAQYLQQCPNFSASHNSTSVWWENSSHRGSFAHGASERWGSHSEDCGSRKQSGAVSPNRTRFLVVLKEASWVIYFITFPLANLWRQWIADLCKTLKLMGKLGGTTDPKTLLFRWAGQYVSQGNPIAEWTGCQVKPGSPMGCGGNTSPFL